ncbi:MAG TPA: hypothetical protein VK817_13860 [Trebonia sp.]|jgi:hypothetical protein|nr:hypothetical protein [Trebonia sp.]
MAEQVTYYAIVDDRSSREEPAGVVRRIRHDQGQRDEAFAYDDLSWEHTSLLYAYERGDGDNQLYEITEDEANQIVERIRRTVTGQA